MEAKAPTKNISQVRTFRDDLSHAQGSPTPTQVPKKKSHIPKKKTTPVFESAPIAETPVHEERGSLEPDVPTYEEPVSHTHTHIPTKLVSLPQQEIAPKKEVPLTPLSSTPTVQPELNAKYEVLKEEVDAVSQHTVKSSILSDDASVYDKELGGGTIIRDTKRKRFRLIPAMIDATRGWFTSQKTGYAKKHEPYTVAKAESRTETIVEAAKSSEKAPTEDFATVVKRLKQVPRTQISSTLTFKKKADLPKPEWTHVTEDQGPVVSQERVTPQAEPDVQEEVPTVPPVPQQEEESDAVQSQQEVLSTAVSQERVTQDEPATLHEVLPTVEAGEEESGYAHMPEVEEVPEEVATPLPNPPVPSPVKEEVPQYQTTTARNVPRFPYALLVGVVLIMTALGMGTSYYFFVLQRSQGTVEQPAITQERPPELITTDFEESILIQSKEQLLEELVLRTQERNRVTQFYPTIVEGELEVPAGALTIMSVLGARTQESFNRNIEEMTFGTAGNGQSFLVLEIANFDIAFSGMLAWEKSLSSDLHPLFGEIVRETYDPTSRTNSQLTPAYFKDAIANNAIVRVLLDENGDDRITYTFVDRDTILITTTRQTLQDLLPRIQ